MRHAHSAIGLGTVLIFLGTGQLLRHHTPPMDTLSDSARLLLRSRHIYILASGLVNLMLGLYLRRQAAGWRSAFQWIGSGMLAVSAAVLTVAFFVEPGTGFRPEMPWSSVGLYSLFGGCCLHVSAAAGRSGGEAAPAQNSRTAKTGK